MSYYLGLDNGGTTTKATIYDNRGKEMGTHSMETRTIVVRTDFVERDMEEMWEANCAVIREVLQKTNIAGSEIACVAICGHGKGLYLWGKDNKPVRNGIISTDNRAWEYPVRWKSDGTEDKLFALTCQHILACQPVSLLCWLRDHEPQALQNIQWVFEAKDYVRFRLTGEARAELTDYSGSGLLNLHTRSFDPVILELLGIPEIWPALPPLCNSTDICGAVSGEAAQKTGLPKGIPVAGGMFDINACALAVDVLDEEHLCMIAGTWSINEFIRKSPVLDGSVLMNSIFCLPEYYLVEESSPTSAGNNEWFIQNLLPELAAAQKQGGKSIYDIANEWVASVPAEEYCPVFLPFLMASNVHPNAKACFVGMSTHHTRAHIMRSVYEGIVFSHKYHLNKLLAAKDTPTSTIRLAGGVARSRVWTQIFADAVQMPVETVEVNETGTLGCAIVAAVAAGEYATVRDAAARMCRIGEACMPDPGKAEIYEKKYQLYLKSIEALDSLWDTFAQITQSGS